MQTADILRVGSSDGTPIALCPSGQGPSLVVVHGAAADSAAFSLVAPLLVDDFTVYPMDRRGRGESGDGPEYSFAREVDDVVAAVHAVPGPAYLYGHSFGGALAWEAALRLPDLAGLILYEGGPKPPIRFIPDEVITELQALVDAGRTEDALSRFLLTAAGVADTELAELQRQEAWPGRVKAARTIPRELRAYNDYAADPESFERITTPALLLMGSDSLPRRRELVTSIATKIGNARVVELAGQGHAANTTAPHLLAGAIRGVLEAGGTMAETSLIASMLPGRDAQHARRHVSARIAAESGTPAKRPTQVGRAMPVPASHSGSDTRIVGENRADAEFHRIDVGGLSVGYRQAGSGSPLVLLHGAFEDSRCWGRQLDELSDEFTVIALDAPGFGASDDPPPTWTTADYGNHLGDILDALGLSRPTVVGLSFGSVYALALYRQRPQAVGALVLVSAYAGWAGSLPPEEVQRRVEQSEREMTGPVDQLVGHWLPTLLTPTAPPDVVSLVSEMMREFHPSGMRPALHALGAVDLRDVLATITVPTLLVYGDVDVRSPADVVGEDMRARIRGSTLVVISGAPHLVNLEQPEAFNVAIRQFTRELR